MPKTAAVKSKKPPTTGRKPKAKNPRSGHPMDIHIGHRLRLRREVLGISQTSLADALHLTFQQIQKYERGANRVSASRLYDLAEILGVDLGYFFSGFNEEAPARVYGDGPDHPDYAWLEDDGGDIMERPETLRLVQTYYKVRDAATRKGFLKLLNTLVSAQGAD